MKTTFIYTLTTIALSVAFLMYSRDGTCADELPRLHWEPLPSLPGELGVAGPFVGVHADALMVAGGANFAKPVWESNKLWHDKIYVLEKNDGGQYEWKHGGQLSRPIAYGAAVSTNDGVVCIGGNDSTSTYDRVFLLRWNATTQSIQELEYPSLPKPCAFGQAVLVGGVIYLAGGQTSSGLDSTMNNFWMLDLSQKSNPTTFRWQELIAWSDEPRAFNITAAQNNGAEESVYVMSGRRQVGGNVQFLRDVWEFSPTYETWRQRKELPRSVCAGTGVGYGDRSILVLSGDDGSLFDSTDELKDRHPGFVKEALSYDTIDDNWVFMGTTPQNQVTTIPVVWDGSIIVASGEVRPRVRTTSVWSISNKALPEKN